jgi:DNA-binding PadR family transcriptional regulator
MAQPRDLFPGALEMMVLRLVQQEPLHGYALVQRIRQVSNDLLRVEEGSLYPALQRLLKAKLVQAKWGVSGTNRRVRICTITPQGANTSLLRCQASSGCSRASRSCWRWVRLNESAQMVRAAQSTR